MASTSNNIAPSSPATHFAGAREILKCDRLFERPLPAALLLPSWLLAPAARPAALLAALLLC